MNFILRAFQWPVVFYGHSSVKVVKSGQKFLPHMESVNGGGIGFFGPKGGLLKRWKQVTTIHASDKSGPPLWKLQGQR